MWQGKLGCPRIMSLRKFGSELCKHDKVQISVHVLCECLLFPATGIGMLPVPSYRSAAEQPGITKLQGLSSITPWKGFENAF